MKEFAGILSIRGWHKTTSCQWTSIDRDGFFKSPGPKDLDRHRGRNESVRIIVSSEWKTKKGSGGCPWHVPSAEVQKGLLLMSPQDPSYRVIFGAMAVILAIDFETSAYLWSIESKSLSFGAK